MRGRLVAVPDLLDVNAVSSASTPAPTIATSTATGPTPREAALRDVGLEYVEVVGRDLPDQEWLKDPRCHRQFGCLDDS